MKPSIGLSDKDRGGVVDLLNTLLSDEVALYVKTRNYHWNVTGPHFSELHKFFEAQYEALDDILDDVAERARALGVSLGTMADFLKHARVKEAPAKAPNALAMVADLLESHETIIQALRGDLEAAGRQFSDAGTSDFLTGVMEQHEKMAWMLRAYL